MKQVNSNTLRHAIRSPCFRGGESIERNQTEEGEGQRNKKERNRVPQKERDKVCWDKNPMGKKKSSR